MTDREREQIRTAATLLRKDYPEHPVQKHYPRMVKAFNKGGFNAVNKYMAMVIKIARNGGEK